MNNIDRGDFVYLLDAIEDLEKNSVGIVTDKAEDIIEVFFIGKKKNLVIEINKIAFLDVTKTGKPYPQKICNVCHVLKDYYKDFDINQTDAKGGKTTRPSCKVCREAIDGASLKPEESARLEKDKPQKLFTCPICGKMSIVNITANLVKDHNHHTGNAREWICDSCNTGLGRFKDDIELLEKAIEYLNKYREL